VETRTVTLSVPADPANLDSEAKLVPQAGNTLAKATVLFIILFLFCYLLSNLPNLKKCLCICDTLHRY